MKNAYNGGHLGLRLHLSAPKVQHLMKSQEALRKTTIISTCLQMTERDAYLHGFLLYKAPRTSVRNVNWILSSDAITITITITF